VLTVLPSLSAVGSWEEVLLFSMDFTVSQNFLELELRVNQGLYLFLVLQFVLLDFSVDFDIIDHGLLLEKLMCYGFPPPARMCIKSTCLTEHRLCSLMEDSLI
jgi:hypothetical protein